MSVCKYCKKKIHGDKIMRTNSKYQYNFHFDCFFNEGAFDIEK